MGAAPWAKRPAPHGTRAAWQTLAAIDPRILITAAAVFPEAAAVLAGGA